MNLSVTTYVYQSGFREMHMHVDFMHILLSNYSLLQRAKTVISLLFEIGMFGFRRWYIRLPFHYGYLHDTLNMKDHARMYIVYGSTLLLKLTKYFTQHYYSSFTTLLYHQKKTFNFVLWFYTKHMCVQQFGHNYYSFIDSFSIQSV